MLPELSLPETEERVGIYIPDIRHQNLQAMSGAAVMATAKDMGVIYDETVRIRMNSAPKTMPASSEVCRNGRGQCSHCFVARSERIDWK